MWILGYLDEWVVIRDGVDFIVVGGGFVNLLSLTC
jgi:hypothetical protein